jgi:hypothetical protein
MRYVNLKQVQEIHKTIGLLRFSVTEFLKKEEPDSFLHYYLVDIEMHLKQAVSDLEMVGDRIQAQERDARNKL